jgi:uncharacterized protein
VEALTPEPIRTADLAAVLALNNAHAAELSWLEAAALDSLISEAFHARRIGALDAFIIVLDETASYRSPNYLWFRARRKRFVYVDRIVVASHARGRGLARILYNELFEAAKSAGHGIVCCEVNSDPPNPASDEFHASLGFVEVGEAILPGGEKSVRYFERALA